MGTTRKFTVRTMAVAALIGAFGATGTAIASADTLVDVFPDSNAGAHCIVVDDNDDVVDTFYSSIDCYVAQSDINKDDRRSQN